MLQLSDIHLRDPYVFVEDGTYYLYGSNGPTAWSDDPASAHKFSCYWSNNLVNWQGPQVIFEKSPSFWGKFHFWAPELHKYNGTYYLLASFKAAEIPRGTAVLSADNPKGPFHPVTNSPVTPSNWESLDGTLYVDGQNKPWMIFCHEWVQIHDGTIDAVQLSGDLSTPIGQPIKLFSASSAAWTIPAWDDINYVTDGPFIHKTADGKLLMIWSSFSGTGYAIGQARSISGEITGPWEQNPEALYSLNGGHGMIFRTLGGQLMLTLHQPNESPSERPVFLKMTETPDGWLSML